MIFNGGLAVSGVGLGNWRGRISGVGFGNMVRGETDWWYVGRVTGVGLLAYNNAMERTVVNRRVVVTGGAGFIGSHLVAALGELGAKVIVIDDLSSGKKENLDMANVELIVGSVTDRGLLREAFTGAEWVFHEAALASVPKSIEDPLGTHEVNTTGTLNVLEAARERGVRKVVFASSCAIYGNTWVIPTPEETPADPQSPYAVTKLMGEYYM